MKFPVRRAHSARVPRSAGPLIVAAVAAAASFSAGVGAAESSAANSASGKVPTAAPADLGDVKTIAPSAVKESPDAARAAAAAAGQGIAPVQRPAKAGIAMPGTHAFDFSKVCYSQPGDGSIWAVGRNYKAQFSADGVVFVPYLGSDAPHNFPVAMHIKHVSVGGKPMTLAAGAQPVQTGDRIVIDHGMVQEIYLLTPDSIEQEFTFASNPGTRGDLVVELAVQSELVSEDAGTALRFGNQLGGVTYSKAVIVDAASRHTPAPTSLAAGNGIKITVPQVTLASAAYPLTIDPIIATYGIASSISSSDRNSDIAYDNNFDGYCVAWEFNFSATDGDIYTERYGYDGTLVVGSLAAIDSTSANWRNPKIADNKLNANYLVVAEVGNAPNRAIWGATRAAGSSAVSAQIQVSDPATSGDKTNPDVGGDPDGTAPVNFLVVWERDLSASDHDIHGRLVTPVPATAGATILIDNSGATVDITPSVSKTDGAVVFTSQNWTVVWDRANNPTDHDIYGARIAWDGGITSPTFAVDTSGSDNRHPAVSTIRDSDLAYMVVYEENPNGIADLWGRVFIGTSLISGGNLTTLEGVESADARRQPAVDSTLDKFVVASCQQFSGTDWDAYVSTYCYDGSGIRVAEQHRVLDFDGDETSTPQVASIHSATGGTFAGTECNITWSKLSGTGFGNIAAAFVKAKPTCCRSDVDSNNFTNIDDLLAVINNWGSCPTFNCPADVDGNAYVNIDDLLAVINGWGACP